MWNRLAKEETETSLWLIVRIEGKFMWFSIKWYLFEEVLQEKFVVKSLQVVVFLFEIACIFTLSRWNILVKEESETSLWLMVRIEGKFIWFSIKWYLFEEVSQEKFVVKSLQVVAS